MLLRYLVVAALGFTAAPCLAQPAARPLESIEVVGQTPLGAGLEKDEIASNVQSVTSAQMRAQRALDLSDFMRRNLSSVFINEAQSNPLQPDLQYRGFVGSPLLGLPQGIAVYQDGVRINEPFGDTVNWALIPDSAIDTVYLMPGSNPLFGLNALGGAISIRTKDGATDPGSSIEVHAGSFSRFGFEAETGGTFGNGTSYFATGSHLEEDGWRDFSPTEATQLFASIGWQLGETAFDASITYANTDLIGNGAAPVELLARNRAAIFTRPDRTRNELALLNLSAERAIAGAFYLRGNVYSRSSDIDTHNGDDSDFRECAGLPGYLCESDDGAELPILDTAGAPVPATPEVEGATINRTATDQDGAGMSLQASWSRDFAGRRNDLVMGLAYDGSAIAFASSTELGMLDPTRLAVPSSTLIGDSFTDMRADSSNFGLYASDTFALTSALALTVSARYNETSIRLRDLRGTALDGTHRFTRVNPAIGLTYALSERLTFYAGYSESNRTPSPVELTCADADDPCRLPNAFLADPPLEQVAAGTFEAGLRAARGALEWHAGYFRTTNTKDILFVSAGALTNQGYFANVGKTRRDGVEIEIEGARNDRLSWFANYTYLEATFRESFMVTSPNNPAALDGEIPVERGDRLPLVPSQLLKLGARFELTPSFTIGGEWLASSGVYLRGDEANLLGKTADYAVLNVRADYAIRDRMRLFLNIDNVLDRDFETFGVLGDAERVLGPTYTSTRFLSPAAPRAAWLGLEIDF